MTMIFHMVLTTCMTDLLMAAFALVGSIRQYLVDNVHIFQIDIFGVFSTKLQFLELSQTEEGAENFPHFII